MTTQLTPVESLRAAVLIEEALKQLAFVGRLAKDPKTIKSNEFSSSMGYEIIRIIGEQQELEEMYASRHPQTAACRQVKYTLYNYLNISNTWLCIQMHE